MQQRHGTEITFTVHPRPAATDPAAPLYAGRLPSHFNAGQRGTAAEDVRRHRDTPAGDIAFLARFAFGGY